MGIDFQWGATVGARVEQGPGPLLSRWLSPGVGYVSLVLVMITGTVGLGDRLVCGVADPAGSSTSDHGGCSQRLAICSACSAKARHRLISVGWSIRSGCLVRSALRSSSAA